MRGEVWRVPEPPPRPLLVYDGDCDFCRAWVGRWQARAGGRFDVAPYQDAAARFPTLPVELFRQAVRLIEPDGRVSSGAEAVFRGLALAPDGGRLLRAYERVPGFRPLADGLYRLVADHRPFFTRLTAPFDPEVAREAQGRRRR